MMSLINFIKEKLFDYPDSRHIYEMATIGEDVLMNRQHKSIQIHGSNAGDKEYPHIHIYDYNDKIGFNFEISLVDLLVHDELVIIKMVDKKNHIKKTNRSKCSWNGYSKLKNDFEDWLNDETEIPGDYKNNLHAIIYWYNRESVKERGENPILKYLSDRGMKLHDNYKYLFNSKDIEKYNL